MCSYNRSGYVYVPTIGLGVEGFIIVHVLTTGLGVAGFVLLLQCTYRRPGCCRLCVTVVHVLTTGLGVNQDNADLK